MSTVHSLTHQQTVQHDHEQLITKSTNLLNVSAQYRPCPSVRLSVCLSVCPSVHASIVAKRIDTPSDFWQVC